MAIGHGSHKTVEEKQDIHTAKLKGGPVLKPIGGKMLVELFEGFAVNKDGMEVTDGGIILPETAETAKQELRKRPMEGRVIALGKGKKLPDGTRDTFDVSIGSTIIFGKYAGNSYMYTDEEGNERTYLLVEEYDILAEIVEC